MPCQPHSVAGERGGADDERDLWPEFARLVREIRPRWVVAENVPGLLSTDAGRFFGGILRDLADSGYDAEWSCVGAADIGAPHRRRRVWIVAYPNGERKLQSGGSVGELGRWPGDGGSAVADAHIFPAVWAAIARQECRAWDAVACLGGVDAGLPAGMDGVAGWERGVPRTVGPGLRDRAARVSALGNSVVPQIVELIGRAIMRNDR